MSVDASGRVRSRIRVEGIVQGVGYRPFVHELAGGLGLVGLVGNDAAGVFIEAEGSEERVQEFVAALRVAAPALAVVESVTIESITPRRAERSFRIVASATAGDRTTLVAPDTATCAECLAEVFDPRARRYRYPFTNCTRCGPRLTIVTGLPYDRAATTMAGYQMCRDCADEYDNPADRRFHAQPVCCPRCGPSLRLLASGVPIDGDAMASTSTLLDAGQVVAVKGLGGYHLAVDAASELAVSTLRSRKHREEKPFAILARDLDAVAEICEFDAAGAAALSSRRRPIVLLARRTGTDDSIAPSVAPGNRHLGVMLPYTPLHHLLVRELGRPLVLTSGNVSDEPIAFDDEDAVSRLSGIADAFLTHDRRIHTRVDDSVVRVRRGREMPVRRSRGYAPEPLRMPWTFPKQVLGCGAQLKNTFCLGRGSHAFVSHHVGDLENYETLRAFSTGIDHYRRLFDVVPTQVAHDLHPEYLSTKFALDLAAGSDVELVGVQHHHAHIASCLADNGEPGPVIGIALDGLGYGADGTLWGGEVLVADLAGFSRVAHLEPVRMPGGAAAVREPWRMSAAYLYATYGEALPMRLGVVHRNESRWEPVRAMAARGVNSPLTSSAGRLFDAVAAVLDVRDEATYEGQAAIELEQLVDLGETGGYPVSVLDGDPLLICGTDLVRCVTDERLAGIDRSVIAARFHNGLADALAWTAEAIHERTGLGLVALSGGVFQNVVLVERLVARLERRGLRVLEHSQVPPNDGGISLGQAVVAAAHARGAA